MCGGERERGGKLGDWIGTSGLESSDVLADGLYNAGAVGARDDAVLHGEWVFALGDDQVAVVERRCMDWRIVSSTLGGATIGGIYS